ncbi:hypothetical protein J6590_049450 [Homalodisca vitripennis]|nr:hypothetical protein J6590_049450 [Homalodisca vitripennis]
MVAVEVITSSVSAQMSVGGGVVSDLWSAAVSSFECLWVVVLSVTSGLLLYHLLSDWKELRQGPLRVAVEDSRVSVSNIDFPAVTVCPVNVIDPDRLHLLMTRVLGSGFRDETATRFSTTLKALTMVTNPKWDGGYTYFQSQNVTPFPIRNDDIIPFLKAVTHSIDDIIEVCYWRGSHFNCSDIFRLQSTELGLCHSFNSYTSLQSSTDSKMNPPFRNERGELVGFRSISEGRSSGIDLILHPKQSVSSGNIIVRNVLTTWLTVDLPTHNVLLEMTSLPFTR